MAHFAEIDADRNVLRVIVVEDDKCLDADGSESEAIGASYCSSLLGGEWVQTSYNSRIRKNFAGIGYHYDSVLDAFVPPRPFLSWGLNTENCSWEPPVPRPEGYDSRWDEETLSWVAAEEPVAE